MLLILTPILLGVLAGFLVNYLADVLPRWRSLPAPRCVSCGQAQPVLNYFLWPRRCPDCGHSHWIRSLLVEISMLLAAVWLWQSPPPRLGFAPGFGLAVFFMLVVVIDLEHRLILHPVSLVGAVLGLAIGTWQRGLWLTLLGGAVGFGTMLLFYYLGGLFTRLAARMRGEMIDEVALGFGDVNLSGILGLLLGYPLILLGLLLGVLAGGAFSFLYLAGRVLIRRYREFEAIPYAPYLVLGASLLLYFPEASRSFLLRISPLLATVLSH